MSAKVYHNRSSKSNLAENPDRIEFLIDLQDFKEKWPNERLLKALGTSRQALDYHRKKEVAK